MRLDEIAVLQTRTEPLETKARPTEQTLGNAISIS